MAGRTSTSVGVGITITLFSVTSLTFLVLWAIYFGKYTGQREEFNQLKNDTERYIRSTERNNPAVSALADQARKDGKSLVGFMQDRVGGVMRTVAGRENLSFEQFDAEVKRVVGSNTAPLLSVITSQAGELTTLEARVASADEDRAKASAEVDRVRGQVGETQRALADENARLKRQIESYEGELKGYRDGVASVETRMSDAVRSLESEASERARKDRERISALERENLILVDLNAKLRGEQNKNLLSAQSEEALVDGMVLATIPGGRECVISLGSKQKLQLGMTFAVYADAKQIKPDPKTGEYARPKATLEIIKVDSETSTARITSEVKGSPVVKGDVLANAIYDPSKVYRFVVFGNFDTNADGIATPGERADMVNLVEAWGGRVVDDLAGDVDFLVLGEKPVLPPKPGADVPIEVVQQYVRIEGELQKYDNFYRSAASTSVPILNQNRLFTLIGKK